MPETLYQILGVGSEASEQEIKKIYRKLAKKHHPDAGGDPDEFKRIAEAYEVLVDAERRKRYDETGRFDPVVNVTLEILLPFVIKATRAALENMEDPETVNLVGAVEVLLRKEQAELPESISHSRKIMDRLKAMAERVVRLDGNADENFIAKSFQQPIRQLEFTIEREQKILDEIPNCLEMLKEYKFNTKERQGPRYHRFGDFVVEAMDDPAKGRDRSRYFMMDSMADVEIELDPDQADTLRQRLAELEEFCWGWLASSLSLPLTLLRKSH